MDTDEPREMTVEELEAEEILVLPTREALSVLRPDVGVPLQGAADVLLNEAPDLCEPDVSNPDQEG